MTWLRGSLVAKATILLAILSVVHGARILSVFPMPTQSHIQIFVPLMTALASRGHQMTVISHYPLDYPVENYTDIKLARKLPKTHILRNIYDLRYLITLRKTIQIYNYVREACECLATDPSVQELIHSSNTTFDVIMVDPLLGECTTFLAHRFQTPLIVLSSTRGDHVLWADAVGNSSPYSYVPPSVAALTDRMNKWGKLNTGVIAVGYQLIRHWIHIPMVNRIFKKVLPDLNIPGVLEIEKKIALVLLAVHPGINYPMPTVPALQLVGGLHIVPPKPLPEDLQQFLDEATDGVVYMSLSTQVEKSFIPNHLRDKFVTALAKIKQRVIWRWIDDPIPNLPENIKLVQWVPQADLLAHPNIRVFITQGGYNSATEAMYNGVPMIVMPLNADQFHTQTYAVQSEFGALLDLPTLTNLSITYALHEVLHTPKYRENARRVSIRIRDNLQTPLEKAVYWVEYVIRHKGAPHLRVAAMDLAWYQYLLLDVIATGLLFILLAVMLLYKLTRMWRIKVSTDNS